MYNSLTQHVLLLFGTLAHRVKVPDTHDFISITLARDGCKDTDVSTYMTRPQVIVIGTLEYRLLSRAMARQFIEESIYICEHVRENALVCQDERRRKKVIS
jgi:hypothetical protein